MCGPVELLVYVSVSVYSYVIMGHTGTENQNESKRGLHFAQPSLKLGYTYSF